MGRGESEGVAVPNPHDFCLDWSAGIFRLVVGGFDAYLRKLRERVGGQSRQFGIFIASPSACFFLGFLHQLFVAGYVDGDSPLFGHDAGEVDGEAVGVVQFKGVIGRDDRRPKLVSRIFLNVLLFPYREINAHRDCRRIYGAASPQTEIQPYSLRPRKSNWQPAPHRQIVRCPDLGSDQNPPPRLLRFPQQ